MERVEAGQAFPIFIDYAHTDDALRNALRMLRDITPGRVLCVYGCGGDRDRGKRPAMTKAVADLAHLAWATADNPRKESLDRIFADMREGLGPLPTVEFVTDRRDAIGRALAAAKSGDCVVIAGKGHETTQEFADTVVPFDDRQVVREILELRRARSRDADFLFSRSCRLGWRPLDRHSPRRRHGFRDGHPCPPCGRRLRGRAHRTPRRS